MSRTTITIQWKVIALALVTASIMLGAMVWKTQSLLVADKTAFIMDSAMKQIAPLKRLVQQRLADQKEALVRFASRRAGQPGGTSTSNSGSNTATTSASNMQNASSHAASFGDFDVIALVQSDDDGRSSGSGQSTSQWTPTWIERGPGAKVDRWPKGHDETLLKSLPYAKIRDGETVWTRVSDRQGAPVYAFMISVEIQAPGTVHEETETRAALPDTAEQVLAGRPLTRKAVLVGFASQNPLAEVTEDFIGSTNSVYLVDDRGYVASHVNKAYQGALFTEDPLVREIIKGKKTGSTGRFEDLDSRPVLGHYERIEHSNLYAIITTPEQMLNYLVGSQRKSATELGLAVLVLCAGFAAIGSWLITRGAGSSENDDASDISAEELAQMRPNAPLPEPKTAKQKRQQAREQQRAKARRQAEQAARVALGITAHADDVDDDTPEAFTRFDADESAAPFAAAEPIRAAATVVGQPVPVHVPQSAMQTMISEGLIQALTEPLHGILGHASLVRVKAPDSEVQEHADSIAREARRMREIVERIHEWQDEAKTSDDETLIDVKAAVEGALQRSDTEIVAENVHVVRELRAIPRLRGSRSRFEGAIGRLVENALEAMLARPSKHLKVESDFDGENVVVQVTDTGVGMARDVRDRAFEPFFKGFESPHRLGLGLAAVASTVKAMGGTHDLRSVPGEGTTLVLSFPVAAAEKEAFRQLEAREVAEVVAKSAAQHFDEAAPEKPSPTEHPAEVRQDVLTAFDDDEDEDEDDDLIPLAAFSATRKEITADFAADDDDDDSDDEVFASVALNRAASQLREPGEAAPLKQAAKPADLVPAPIAESTAESTPASEEPSTPKFAVRIRKPRPRSQDIT